THLDPAIQERLVAALLSTAGRVRTPPDDLTTREVEVLKLIAAGLSNAEIAAALVVSAATVKTHINHIFAKTGARDRAQAVRYATNAESPNPQRGSPHMTMKGCSATSSA